MRPACAHGPGERQSVKTEFVTEWPTILLVDPVIRSQVAVADILEGMPINLAKAHGLAEAITLAKAVPPQCIVAEMRYPDGQLRDLVGAMRKMGYTAPVIVYSGSLTKDSLKSFIPLGVHATLSKPPSREAFLSTIKGALETKSDRQEIIAAEPEESGAANILVQDDVGFSRFATSEVLKSFGYNVMESDSAQTGLKIIQENRIDLVITDIVMPGMDGIDFLKVLRAIPNRPPALILTCTRDTERIQSAVRMGAKGILLKPLDAPRLGRAVQETLAASRDLPRMAWGDGIVLVVDNDAATNYALEVLLMKRGLHTVAASTPYDALREGDNGNLVAAVVAMDLPGHDMPQLVRDLKELESKPPVILTYRKLGHREMALVTRLGASKVFEKPFDIDNLVAYIESLVLIGDREESTVS